MPRRLEIALTLIVFTIVMLALSALVHAYVPGLVDWLNDVLGKMGALIAIFAVIIAAGVYAWVGHRRAGTKPKGM